MKLIGDAMLSEVAQIDNNHVLVAMTREELILIAGALNEALEAVDDWEFGTRLGVPSRAARQLKSDVHFVLDDLQRTD